MGSPENAEQLMIALEPEAAAIFCQEKNMSDFRSETGRRSVDGILSQPNTNYMVVDIGGNCYYYYYYLLLLCLKLKIKHKATNQKSVLGHMAVLKVDEKFFQFFMLWKQACHELACYVT